VVLNLFPEGPGSARSPRDTEALTATVFSIADLRSLFGASLAKRTDASVTGDVVVFQSMSKARFRAVLTI
jgi:hypothetical protein